VFAFGAVLVAAALAFRFSPWAQEYRLKKASLSALQAWAARSPGDARVQYYLGAQYFNKGYVVEALQSFERAAALDPRMARAHLGAAVAHREIGNGQQSSAAAGRALELDPSSAEAQYLRAIGTLQTSVSHARPEFQKLTRMAPRRADGWYWLGTCEQTMSQLGDAVGPFRRAVELEPSNAAYRRDLAKVLIELSRFGEAREQLERAVQLDPKDAAAAYYLGKSILMMAAADVDVQAADRWLQKALGLLQSSSDPSPSGLAEMSAERAVALRRLNRLREAESLLQQARKLDPNKLGYLYQLAEVTRNLGREERARALMLEHSRRVDIDNEVYELSQRIKQDLKNPDLRLRVARAFARGGDYPRAIFQYEVSLQLAPKQRDAARELQATRGKLAALQRKQGVSGKAATRHPAAVYQPSSRLPAP
jgi:tetratricopeptide (TPR) repeat protein